MRIEKHKSFCLVLLLSILFSANTKAQQELGQVVINAGYGYSPEFDGEVSFADQTAYPVKITSATTLGGYSNPNAINNFYDVSYNKEATIDVGLIKGFSIGAAASYQTEVVNWAFESINNTYSDDVTRTNLALRLLYHPPAGKYIDGYFGIRSGISYWHDTPYQTNYVTNIGRPDPITFLTKPNLSVPSFQILCGLRYYPIPFIGIHIEAGIGSPYVAEAGITFSINFHKANPAQENNGNTDKK